MRTSVYEDARQSMMTLSHSKLPGFKISIFWRLWSSLFKRVMIYKLRYKIHKDNEILDLKQDVSRHFPKLKRCDIMIDTVLCNIY